MFSVAQSLRRTRDLRAIHFDASLYRPNRCAIGPVVGRLLQPLMDEPSELVGTGEVVQGAELVRGDPLAS
jgi:hypothetical protein